MLTQIATGIYVGDITTLSTGIPDLNIIINLSGKNYSRTPVRIDGIDYRCPKGVEVFDYLLPSQELMDTERPKTIVKLETVAKQIVEFRASGKTILIHDLDGKNKCMLVAGYYLIMKCNEAPFSVVRRLETLYFSKQQITDDDEDNIRSQQYDPDEDPNENPIKFTVDELKSILSKREERRELRCLTMKSFVQLLNGLR